MSSFAFAWSVIALLFVPGPTNALMAVAGAQGGLGRVLRLLPVVLAAYMATILMFVWIGAGLLAAWPALDAAVKIATAAWVIVLAVKLWDFRGRGGAGAAVSARALAVTSALNPKGLVLGLVLMPRPGDPEFTVRLAYVALAIAGAAALWGVAGLLAQENEGGGRRIHLVQRAASVLLAVVSVSLIANVVAT